MINSEAVIQALASMKLDGLKVSQNCIDKITKKEDNSKVKTMTLIGSEKNNGRGI